MTIADVQPTALVRRPGIRGWLILPAILVVINPLVDSYGFVEAFPLLTSPRTAELEQDFPGIRLFIVSTTAISLPLVAFQVFLAIVFFMKKPYVPKLMVTYFALNLGLAVVMVLTTAEIFNGIARSGLDRLMTATVEAAIWIPYFLVSKRVKATFVSAPPIEHARRTGPAHIKCLVWQGLPLRTRCSIPRFRSCL